MANPNLISGTIGALALDSVQKSTSLRTLLDTVFSTDSISVVLPDFTRPLPFESSMMCIENAFPNVRHWMIGLGLHRRLNILERTSLTKLTDKPVLEHDPDVCTPVYKSNGRPFGIATPLTETDWTLTVGVMEVHQYAGVSGGYKGVVVGCGDRDTISRLHSRELVCHPDVQVGKVLHNPFRTEIERLGRYTPCLLGLMWVPSLDEWWLGKPDALMEEAHRMVSPWTPINEMYEGVLLSVPKSKGESFYQASRAATYLALSPNPPLLEGGTIVIDAEMNEGLGAETGFVQYLQRYKPPWSETLALNLVGAGSQRLWMLARLAQRFDLYVRGVKNPSVFRDVGIPIYDRQVPDRWLRLSNPFGEIPQCTLSRTL